MSTILFKFIYNWKILSFILCFSFIATFFTSGFSLLYGDFNSWSDINVYYTIGKGIFFDKIPYKDLFDHKGPIIFFIYYLGYILSPNSFQGMYIIQSIFLFIELVFIYRTAIFFLPKSLSILSTIIFTLLFNSFNKDGGSAEEFILVFIIISFYYFIRYYKEITIEHTPKVMFIHSILFTVTFFIKLNLIIFWFLPILSIFIFLFYKKKYKNLLYNLICFIVGFILITIITLSYFYINNALTDLWNAYIVVNSKYGKISTTDLYDRIYRGIFYLYLLARTYYVSFAFILLSLVSFFFIIPKSKRLFSYVLILTYLFQYYTLVLSPTIITYYFIIYLTFVPLGIIFFLRIINYISKIENQKLKDILYYSTCAICFLFVIKSKNFYDYSYNDIINKNYYQKSNLEIFEKKIASSNDNTFFCLGLDLGVDLFTISEKVPNVKYFFTPNIRINLYPELYQEQEFYIKNKDVKFVIMYKNFLYKDLFTDILSDNGYQPLITDSLGYTLYSYPDELDINDH